MKNYKNILIFVLWCAVVIFSIFHHEIWRDEAQVWCIVRDVNLSEIFQITKIEGHPMLWYLLVLPFAKFGFPVETMYIISFLFVGLSILFLLYKSPFTLLEKILIVFSSGMVYFLPAIARNYALIPLFVFLLAYLYHKRSQHPYKYSLTLILLSQTHVLMLCFCAILFVFFLCENINVKKNYFPVFVVGINFLFLVYCFSSSSGQNTAVLIYGDEQKWGLDLLVRFSNNYLYSSYNWLESLNCIFFYSSICALLVSFFKLDKKIFTVFAFSFVYIFYIYAKVWFAGVPEQKAYLLLLIIVFCFWVLPQKTKLLKTVFLYFFIVSTLISIPFLIDEYKNDFSGANQLSKYIKENVGDKDFIYWGYAHSITPLSAKLPKSKFYSGYLGKYVTYYDFTNSNRNSDVQDINKFEYFILQDDFYLAEGSPFNKVYETSKYILGSKEQPEVYSLYKRKKL